MLAALRERRPVDQPVALVVAHPDDETLAAGGSLPLFRRLLLVHVTDGAPRRLGDAAREGFASPADYAAARARELEAALALSGAEPTRIALGIPDQEATEAVPAIAARLRMLFAAHGIACALTHPYEGGHPDHDAVTAAVHAAGSEVFEFTGYHAGPDGGMRTGVFLEAGDREQITVPLCESDLQRKRAMLACFQTQRDVLSRFDPTFERFRRAPAYDFQSPPHPGRLLYEEWGWMSGAAWRKRVRCAA
ncbi:MAG: PIG-L family deacetylase [Acetobacteraceae bacterium]|nr:PIG-L family deacetylase [Acetobacteraceae bacterium]